MILVIYVIIAILTIAFAYGVMHVNEWSKATDLIGACLIGALWIITIPAMIVIVILWVPIKKLYALGQRINEKYNIFEE